MYDPVQRHLAIERIVTSRKGVYRKYYRFRPSRWYGGIVTADAVGCGLTCKFCWTSTPILENPDKCGDFYAPEKVAEILLEIARRKGLSQLRISSGEPTIGRVHLLKLLENLEREDYSFIVETNGILLGYDKKYAEELARFKFIHVRVSIKGCKESEFTLLTGAKPEGFLLQFKALENLLNSNVKCHASVMASFSPHDAIINLRNRIRELNIELAGNLEIEELIVYPRVKRKIEEHNLKYYSADMPSEV